MATKKATPKSTTKKATTSKGTSAKSPAKKRKIVYSEPDDYIPKKIADKFFK